MKEPIVNKKVLAVLFGLLFIGGAAAVLGIYRSTKSTERSLGCVIEEPDGDIFVCGAHA